MGEKNPSYTDQMDHQITTRWMERRNGNAICISSTPQLISPLGNNKGGGFNISYVSTNHYYTPNSAGDQYPFNNSATDARTH